MWRGEFGRLKRMVGIRGAITEIIGHLLGGNMAGHKESLGFVGATPD